MTKGDLKSKLESYRVIKAKIKELELEIKEIELGDISIGASNFEEHYGYDVSSSTENKAMKRLEKVERKQLEIKRLEIKIEKIENLFSVLNENERSVLENRYLKGYNYNRLIYIHDKQYSSIKAIERKAFEKMLKVNQWT